jgi:DNA-binding PadR family transcriptional regulator
MATTSITLLGYALLGLIHQEPRSGYALRMVFETTPMGNYSSSPGSIYPALEKLRKAKLIVAREPGRDPGRSKGLLHLTAAGTKAFMAWLGESVTSADVPPALLKFAFLQYSPDRDLTRAFLDSFGAATSAQAESLKEFLASEAGRALSPQSRVAVEHGRRSYKESAQWAVWARQTLEVEWRR